jgi:hypothetical protein
MTAHHLYVRKEIPGIIFLNQTNSYIRLLIYTKHEPNPFG